MPPVNLLGKFRIAYSYLSPEASRPAVDEDGLLDGRQHQEQHHNITTRASPSPKPLWGGAPNLKLSK